MKLNRWVTTLLSCLFLFTTACQSASPLKYHGPATSPDLAEAISELRAAHYTRAQTLLEDALRAVETADPRQDVQVATVLTQLGQLRLAQGLYEEALDVYQRVLAINEQIFGVEHPSFAASLDGLAQAYRGMGRFAEAEEAQRRALGILEVAFGPKHPKVARSLTNLALISYSRDRLVQAEALLDRAQQILKESDADPLERASTAHTLGAVVLSLERVAEAEQQFTQALEIRKRVLGPKHPLFAQSLSAVALVKDRANQVKEARALYQRVLAIQEASLGKDHPDVAYTLFYLGWSYQSRGETATAAPLFLRSLKVREKALGPDHPVTAESLEALGIARWNEEADGDAEALLRRALAIRERTFGSEHVSIAGILDALAWVRFTTGSPDELEVLFRRALTIRELVRGQESLDTAESLRSLGEFYRLRASKPAEAVHLFLRALTITEAKLGPEHSDVADLQQLLGAALYAQERYGEAARAYRRAVAIRRRDLDEAPLDLAKSLESLGLAHYGEGNYQETISVLEEALSIVERSKVRSDSVRILEWLGNAYVAGGRTGEAERLFERALTATKSVDKNSPDTTARLLTRLAGVQLYHGQLVQAERNARDAVDLLVKQSGPRDDLVVADSLFTLGQALRYAGRFAEAESILGRVVAVRERLRPESLELGRAVAEMGEVYEGLWKVPEAEVFFQRAWALFQQQGQRAAVDTAQQLINLGGIYQAQKRFDEAEAVLTRAHMMVEKRLGPDDPEVARILGRLAALFQARGRSAEAVERARRALAIYQTRLGSDDLQTAGGSYTLAEVLLANGDYEEAGRLAEQALQTRETTLGAEHWLTGRTLVLLAQVRIAQGRLSDVIPLAERARRILIDIRRANVALDDAAWREIQGNAARYLRDYVGVLAELLRTKGRQEDPKLLGDGFQAAEQIRFSSAQGAIGRAAARATSSEPRAIAAIRSLEQLRMDRQAVIAQGMRYWEAGSPWQQLSRRESTQRRLQELEERIDEAMRFVEQTLPRYAELAFPAPIDVQSVQRLLRANEGLISYLVLSDRILMWLVRADRSLVYRDVPIQRQELTALVTRVRASLDQQNNPLLLTGHVTPFDVRGAFDLFRILLGPIESDIVDLSHLVIVPDEVLVPLPFGALVTDNHAEPYQRLVAAWEARRFVNGPDADNYKSLRWLSRSYSVSVLPGATSLRGLREWRTRSEAQKEPFIGIGDPDLDGVASARGGTMISDETGVAPDALRKLGALPGTRDELLALARVLGADPGTALYLRDRARKPVVQALSDTGRLRNSRVVAFATHALIGGELRGLREPALVLTPPAQQSESDDGLLRLRDILGLQLDGVEWVILSACNTGGREISGEGLSGLVRAFFYSGASSLLVSHWSVDDRATQTMMKSIFQHYGLNSGAGKAKAEALRRGMMDVLDGASGDSEAFSHPFFWAGFFLAGEGL